MSEDPDITNDLTYKYRDDNRPDFPAPQEALKERTSISRKQSSYDRQFFGGNREKAIQRDGEACVQCGVTREQHRRVYGYDLTVDHIDGKGRNTPVELQNHAMDNLQTLCGRCHGQKDAPQRIDQAGAEDVRCRYFQGGESMDSLAAEYKTKRKVMEDILAFRTWLPVCDVEDLK